LPSQNNLAETELVPAQKDDCRKRSIAHRVRGDVSVSLRWLAAREAEPTCFHPGAPETCPCDRRAATGAIKNAEVFALRHELIEYDGLRYHRDVLSELDKSMGGIPREMLTWINPRLTTLDSYSLPLAHNYLESQNKGGHTDHYRKYFPIRRRENRGDRDRGANRYRK
jgi:hypothetical protein